MEDQMKANSVELLRTIREAKFHTAFIKKKLDELAELFESTSVVQKKIKEIKDLL
jgi:hypothetical protein